ncbi:DNA polymerase III subunit delta [Lentibacillus sediminis]|uniref:DNA polymerase III subunit delta n=1 Tax=Lentibacillus sediminis TaxID=1940529 RepID=UPI000C1B9900|nr:DNA polymerase III subunit delta [Lentibacillus sediminis]
MSYIEVTSQLKKGNISPVYLLYGTETYFIQQLKRQITNTVLNGDEDNLSMYDLVETPIEEVIADVDTYPFFGERKLVIASNPGFLKGKPDKLPFEHDLEALDRYLKSPVDYSVLVLIAEYEKIDERKKISKSLKKHATLADCQPIKEYEVKKWIQTLAGQIGVRIEEDASTVMEAELSANLHLLENELAKIAMYTGENGVITKEIARDMVARTAESSALRLVDAVIERNLHQAIAIYKDLEKQKEEPIAMIGLLAFQFRTILRVKLLRQKGYSQGQMQKQLGLHPYVIKIAMQREKQFSLEKLKSIMDRLANADAVMKQGGMEKGLAFELLLYDLISSKAKATV